jgi:outer membrane protein assembly factor BamA
VRAPTWILALALASWALAAGAASAEVPATLRGARVRAISIEGEMRGRLGARDVGIPLGASLTRRLLRGAVERLLASGRWADVQLSVVPTNGGVRIVARLRPRLVLIRVDVMGNDALSDDQVERALGVAEGEDIERRDLEALRGRVLEAYARKGYHGVVLDLDLLETNDPSRAVLSLHVDEGEPTEVVAIRFEGDALPPESRAVRRALGLSVGDVLDRHDLDEGVRAAEVRLREAGYFEARLGPVAIDRDGAEATVRIRSRLGRHYHVVVRGNEPLDRDDVIDALGLAEDVLSRASAEAMARRVVDLYQRNGFIDAEVTVKRLRGTQVGHAELLVDVRPGEELRVHRVTFPGGHFFEEGFLRDQLESYLDEAIGGDRLTQPVDVDVVDRVVGGSRRARSRPRPYAAEPARVYYPRAYEEALTHIRELYEAEGFLAASVGPHRLTREGGGRAEVTIPVVEGPRTMLHALEIEGNEHVGARDVAMAAGLVRGEPFSRLALAEAERKVRELYQERGYLYAEVASDVRFSGDGTRAAVTLRVTERFEVYVGEILIEGAQATDEDLVRSLLALRTGELYRPSGARHTQERLLDLGVFNGVSVQPQDPDLPARVKPVVITLTERKPQSIDFALGASTAQGVRGAFEYGYGNLFGRALRFSLRVQLAAQFFFLDPVLEERYQALTTGQRLERRVTVGLLAPSLSSAPNLRVSANLLHQRENERNFALDKNAFNATFTYRPSRRFSTSLSSGLEYNDVQPLDSTFEEVIANTTDSRLQRLLRVPEGRTAIVSAESTTTIDLRDNPFNPTRGFYASGILEWARTVYAETLCGPPTEGDAVPDPSMNPCYDANADPTAQGEVPIRFFSHHLRLLLNASGYVPLGRHMVLAVQAQYGRIIHLSPQSKTYPNRQFFLGGVDTMRAYQYQSMIPQDLAEQIVAENTDGDSDFIDPRTVVQGGSTFFIARGELRFPIFGDIGGAFFTEFGNLWVNPRALDFTKLRPTLGLGVRIATPIGPIALDYGFNLLYNRPNRRPLDEAIGAFNFSIGLF